MKFFGSSGIRGLANEYITPQFCLRVGAAVGTQYKRVALGRDPRTTSIMLSNAVSAGLQSAGASVYDVGLVATPTLAHTTRKLDAGIMITASHNPAEYNGVKLWNPDGTSFMSNQMVDIEERLISGEFATAAWNQVGQYHKSGNAVAEHKAEIIRRVGKLDRKLKVVVDCGNGSASTISPYLLRELGCQVISINSQPDGHFPGRGSEPTDENLADLKNTVISSEADLGIAHDGDADRMMAVDDNGQLVTGDQLLTVLAKFEASTKIVVPINASMSVGLYNPDLEIVRTRVGDVFISEAIKKTGAEFGGEPSGTWIFPEHSYCPDGIFAAAKVVKICEKKKLSELVASIPKLHTLRRNYSFEKEARAVLLASLEDNLGQLQSEDVNRVDGTRIQFQNGWVLVRPSGTEPKIRMTCEADTQEEARRLCALVEEEINKCIRECMK